jgi:hypothetical protein
MKRSQRWSLASEEGPGHRLSPTGPFRRRRALRHLDILAQHPTREPSPNAAVAHVRVIGEPDNRADGGRDDPAVPIPPVLEVESAVSPVSAREDPRPASQGLHAVPIDESLGMSSRTAAGPG